MTTSRADAVVVAYRSDETLDRCLHSLRSDPATAAIVVVDNGGGRRTPQITARVPGAVLLEPGENLGFGRGVHLARPLLTAAYVVLANPDSAAEQGTVSAGVQFLDTCPPAGLLSPRVVDRNGALTHSSEREISLARLVAESLGLHASLRITRSEREHERAHRTEALNGAFLIGRVAALDSVGWFDQRIFLFGEDLDLCRRLRAAGWEVWYVPRGRVVHEGGHSWRQLDDEGRALITAARYEQLKRAGSPVQATLYRLLVRAKDGLSGG